MLDGPKHLLSARWVAPMDATPFRDGAVALESGRIVGVGAYKDLKRRHPAASSVHYGDAVILPGLVNAHTHLELSHLLRPQRVESFTDWLGSVMGAAAGVVTVEAAVSDGVAESLQFGITTVGDISRDPQAARRQLARSPINAISYGEVVGMAGRQGQVRPRLDLATDSTGTGRRTRAGIAPHAPYSVDAYGYRRCLDAARRADLPLTTHLAESSDEAIFLAEHAGPFRQLWDRIGAWDGSPPRFTGGPIRYAQSLGLLDYSMTLLAHGNYCDDDELEILAGGRASTVYCPRTHAYFGHPPHRWQEMLAAGMNVCVGTDSRASAPDLNLVDDLRLLHDLAPDVTPVTLWEMATVRAARALGLRHSAGVLAAGGAADCVVFPVRSADPLREILETPATPLAVWADGKEVFKSP